jgi:hypothetical protein
MEKVKLSQRQAEILETELKSAYINGNLAKFAKMYINLGDDDWQEGYPLTCLSDDQVIRALYIGYEVEQTEQEKIQEFLIGKGAVTNIAVEGVLRILGREDLIPKEEKA